LRPPARVADVQIRLLVDGVEVVVELLLAVVPGLIGHGHHGARERGHEDHAVRVRLRDPREGEREGEGGGAH
jgi:hypothetical protein